MKVSTLLCVFVLVASILLMGCHKTNTHLLPGKIKRDAIALSPKVTGRILEVYIEEGFVAMPGDTLAMLDVPEVSAKIAQARGAVKTSSAQRLLADNGTRPNDIKQIRARYLASKDQYEFAEKSYSRANAMFEDSLLSPQAHDEVRAKYQSAKAQMEAASAALDEAVIGTRYETKLETVGQVDQAYGALQEVEVSYSERYIIATNYITIETINLRKGELAIAGYPVFSGYIPNSTWFRFTIPESRVALFKKGEQVTVNVPYLKKTYKGKILNLKQMPRYADITTAYPDYSMDDAVYEIRIAPLDVKEVEGLLYNSTITIDTKNGNL
ncbi:MAG: biotin/lipoyl-binding protein [Chitinophagaceae bacterium]